MGVLQGLAAGTLMYITFFEVLDREKLEKSGMDGVLGVILMLVGFGFMTGLTIIGTYNYDFPAWDKKKLIHLDLSEFVSL